MSSSSSSFSSFPSLPTPNFPREKWQEVCEKFCPVFWIHSKEEFPPSSIDEFLKGCCLVYENEVKSSFRGSKIVDEMLMPHGTLTRDSLKEAKFDGMSALFTDEEAFARNTKFHKQFRLKIVDEKVRYGLMRKNESGDLVCEAPIYCTVSLPPKFREQPGVPEEPHFVDIVYALFNGYNGACMNDPGFIGIHEGDWESVTVRISADLEKILAVRFKAHRERDPYVLWYYPPDSDVPNEKKYEVDKGTGRVVVYSSRSGHGTYARTGKQFYGYLRGSDVCDRGLLWEPRVEIFDQTMTWARFKGNWGISGPQGVMKYITSRALGGPMPLRVYPLKIVWEKDNSGEGYVARGTEIEGEPHRLTRHFHLDNGEDNAEWTIWDNTKTEMKNASFSLFRKDENQPLFSELVSGAITKGNLSYASTEKFYIGELCHEGKPSTPIGEEVTLYVVVAAKKKEKGEKEEQEREKEKEEKEKEQPPLEILLTKDVIRIWDDEGTGASPADVTLFHPRPIPGWYPVGSVAQPGNQKRPFLSSAVMVRAKERKDGPPLLADPVGYTNFFAMGTWSRTPVYLWQPIPGPAYVALGVVATSGNKQPANGACKVVHKSLCRPASVRFTNSDFGRGTPLWSTFKSKARFKATLYQVSNGEIFPEQRTRKLEEEEERQEKEREREQEREEEGGGPLTFVKSENEFGFPGKIAHNFLVSSFYRKEGKEEEGEKERKEEEGEGGKVVTEFRGRSFLPPDCLVRSCYYDLSFQEEGGEIVLPTIHKSKKDLLTLVHSFLSLTLRLPPQKIQSEIKDFTFYREKLLPTYHYTVTSHLTKTSLVGEKTNDNEQLKFSKSCQKSEEKRCRFVACASSKKTNREVFTEMHSRFLLQEEEEGKKEGGKGEEGEKREGGKLQASGMSLRSLGKKMADEEKEEGEEEEGRLEESVTEEWGLEESVMGEEEEEAGNWREIWEQEIEQKATRAIIRGFESHPSTPPPSLVRSPRYTIHFKGLFAQKVYHPVIKCTYSLNGVTTTVWVDGISKQVFTTEPQKFFSVPAASAQKHSGERAGYVSASVLCKQDNNSTYNESCLYLALPAPRDKNTGWFTLRNTSQQPIIFSFRQRPKNKKTGPPFCLHPDTEQSFRYSTWGVIRVISKQAKHLHLVGFSDKGAIPSLHPDLLIAC